MSLCSHVLKLFSFMHFELYKCLRQQESTPSYRRMACGMITISENVTPLSTE